MFQSLKAAIAARLVRFAQRRDGNIALIFGLCAIPVIVGAGVAIDAGRAYMIKMELESALDSAALAVASSTGLSAAQLQTRLQNYFNANYPGTNISQDLTVSMTDPTQPVMTVTASVQVPTTFLKLINIADVPVSVSNQVTRGTNALELALVLDNTGSMMCGDGEMSACSQGVPPTHMDTLRIDAKQIIDTLFADSTDTSKLKIAVVPYVTSVNIGPAMGANLSSYMVMRSSGTYKNAQGRTVNYVDAHGNPAYLDYKGVPILDASGFNITYDSTQSQTSLEWVGCVVEPTAGNVDTTEPAGGWPGPWTPYYWVSGSGSNYTGYNGGTGAANVWVPTAKPAKAQYVETDNGDYASDGAGAYYQSYGPNLGCPKPMVRLTNDQTLLDNTATSLASRANSGTAIDVGMIWGWRALSPNGPFKDGQPYGTPSLIKAVVLETDGDNNTGDYPDYTGFGYIRDDLLGVTTASAALISMQNRLTAVCNNMKAAGIIIYTIGLGDGATNAQLQSCAGPSPGAFYSAPSASQLTTAFQAIAISLNNLRLSK
jgi:Flp pilus assembly protein TadG